MFLSPPVVNCVLSRLFRTGQFVLTPQKRKRATLNLPPKSFALNASRHVRPEISAALYSQLSVANHTRCFGFRNMVSILPYEVRPISYVEMRCT